MSLIHQLLNLERADPYRDFFSDLQVQPRSYQPAMDLVETKDSYNLKANIPGFTKDQIEITAAGSTLTIKGHYEQTKEKSDDKNHIRKERVESSFQRSVQLPLTISQDKIKASLKDGVLEVVVPKEQPKSNRIAIE